MVAHYLIVKGTIQVGISRSHNLGDQPRNRLRLSFLWEIACLCTKPLPQAREFYQLGSSDPGDRQQRHTGLMLWQAVLVLNFLN